MYKWCFSGVLYKQMPCTFHNNDIRNECREGLHHNSFLLKEEPILLQKALHHCAVTAVYYGKSAGHRQLSHPKTKV